MTFGEVKIALRELKKTATIPQKQALQYVLEKLIEEMSQCGDTNKDSAV